MIKFAKKHLNYIYLASIYVLIFSEYPTWIAISDLLLHKTGSNIQPQYLLLWGLIRILIVLPLLFTLMSAEGIKSEKINLTFTKSKSIVYLTFWGTIAFTILGLFLYPWFIHSTNLTPLLLLEYLPIFILFATTNAFVEETFFRGAGLSFIQDKIGFWPANIVQSFFFALIHIINPFTTNPWPFVILTFFLGLLWGWLTKKTKSLVPAIAIHVIADIFVAISLF
jgi:membrane protease YdiL (CAAX protease family)